MRTRFPAPPTPPVVEAPAADGRTSPRLSRRRFARRRVTGRLRAFRPYLLTAGAVLGVAGLVWLFYFSSVLTAEEVQVHGTDFLSARQVEDQAGVPLGRPLARVDLDAVGARVEDLVAVERVDVSRSWPHGVRIDVVERRAVAVVEREGRLQGLDATGVLFRPYASRPRGLPLVRTRATTGTDALAEAARVVTALPGEVVQRVAYVDVATVDEISLRLRRGADVVWGSADESADKARVLDALLDQQPRARRYNVSAPGSPSVRP